MTKHSAGDVVLLRFPFTDLTTRKRRPALVISPYGFSTRYGDLVLLPLTGRKQDDNLYVEGWQ